MGMLIDGEWTDEDVRNTDKDGAFQRVESSFRDFITADGTSGFKAEPRRYHLYIAHNCPWAHRAAMMRKIKKLEDVISMSVSDRPKLHGWGFSQLVDVSVPSPDGVFYLYQTYQSAGPKVSARVTVPTLWDREKKTVVNNESSEIIRMLNREFDEWGDASLDFYPEGQRPEIDRVNDMVYPGLNNGVYRAGFARNQDAYEEAVARVFDTLDTMEDILSRQRYLAGDRITEADWRAFATLVRFDQVYHTHFKCNKKRISEYPNLSMYTRELYQFPGIADTVNVAEIKGGYFGNMLHINPTGIVAIGPDFDLKEAHDRGRLSAAA
ncbi:glutathione S-transferase family protein [Alphaproteobacteria bacterium]|nr:glutathione S-transferase family protein [Alphaproteobacteria bacterium]